MQTLQSSSQQSQALESRYPFPEIQFMRLIVWKSCQTEIKPHGMKAGAGQVFHRYDLPFMPGVAVAFCSRGPVLSPFATMALSQTLSAYHVVDENELDNIEEIVSGPIVDPLAHDGAIEHAEVGDLNGQPALAIQWADRVRERRHISLYFNACGDSRTAREIHFTAPAESFDLARKYFSELLRSLQWYC